MTSHLLNSTAALKSPACGGREPTGYPPKVGDGWGANPRPATQAPTRHLVKVPPALGGGAPAGNPPQWVPGRGGLPSPKPHLPPHRLNPPSGRKEGS